MSFDEKTQERLNLVLSLQLLIAMWQTFLKSSGWKQKNIL